MKNAIIISGNLAQDHEFIYPFYRLLEEDFSVEICMNEGKPGKGLLGTDLPPNKNHLVKSIEKLNINDYNLLIIPGGVKAMEKVRQNKSIINFISEFNKLNRTIGCICSGSQLLISAKIVKNRKVSGYYSMIDDLENAGAEYVDLPAVIDDNLVTTAHYKDMGPWMKAVLEVYARKSKN